MEETIHNRVSHYCQFLDAILYNLAKYVDGQYKVNAKKIDFYLMKCPGATMWRFRRFLGKNGPVWRFFDLNFFQKYQKISKKS